jgi:hypothetical protein
LKESINKHIHIIRAFNTKMRGNSIEYRSFLVLEKVVKTIALFGGLVVDQRIRKALLVTRITEDVTVCQETCFDAFDVIPLVHIVTPPSTLEVVFEFYTEWTIIVRSLKATVDFGAGKDEAATLTKGDDLIK